MANALRLNENITTNSLGEPIIGVLEGPCADLLEGTRNGRLYTKQLWEKVFHSEKFEEYINNGGVIGELDHPETRVETLLKEAAIKMSQKPFMKDGKLVARFDILNTPNGQIARTLAKAGISLGVSSRGNGETYIKEGKEVVNEDTFDFEAFDLVYLPAVKNARMNLITESKSSNNLKESLSRLVESANAGDKQVLLGTLKRLEIPELDIIKESLLNEGLDVKGFLQNLVYEKDGSYYMKPLEAGECPRGFKFISSTSGTDPNGSVSYKGTNYDFRVQKNGKIKLQGQGSGTSYKDDFFKDDLEEDVSVADAVKAVERKAVKRDKITEDKITLDDINNIKANKKAPVAPTTPTDSKTKNESLIRENRNSNSSLLSDSLDNWLMDVAQFTEKITYSDVNKITTKAQVRDLRKIKSLWEEDLTDEQQDTIGQLVKNTIEGKTLPSTWEEDFYEVNSIEDNDNTAGDNSMAAFEDIQEAIQARIDLEDKNTVLREKISAGNAREIKLNEEIEKLKSVVRNLSEQSQKTKAQSTVIETLKKEKQDLVIQLENRNKKYQATSQVMLEKLNARESELQREVNELKKKIVMVESRKDYLKENLNESLQAKDKLIERLSTEKRSLTENFETYKSKKDQDVLTLSRINETLKKDYTIKLSGVAKKVEESQQHSKALNERLTNITESYIGSICRMKGFNVVDFKSKLPSNYTSKDIDVLVERLQGYKVRIDTLPFSTSSKIGIRANSNEPLLEKRKINNPDADVSDDLLDAAFRK